MKFIYNLGVKLYVLLIWLVSPFNSKAKLWVDGRKAIFKRISEAVDKNKPTVWFHVSSLGEFEQGRPVIEAFKNQYPNHQIVLTFFSPSGYEVRKNYEGADAIFYLPSDSARNAKRFINLVNPEMAFFVKYEFWYHYLHQLKKREIKTYIFSAIFRPQQHFFKWYGQWYRKMLGLFDFLWVQNKQSEELLAKIGITNVYVGGDTRFDRVYQIAQNSKNHPLVKLFAEEKQIIVAGSTWEKDEKVLHYSLKTLDDNVNLILAPHEIHKSNISRIKDLFGEQCICLSEANEKSITAHRVLIIDSIGLLSSLYKYANIAYIGGGFGAGIHNTLEAATYGIPVVFGPNYDRFQEAKDLIDRNAGYSISSEEQLYDVISELFLDVEKQILNGKSAKQYVDEMRGGTNLVLNKIKA